MTKALAARRLLIRPDYFAVAIMDSAKVQALVRHLRGGGEVPPVVAALYGDKAMPLDGHHRMEAHAVLGRMVDAGRSTETPSTNCRPRSGTRRPSSCAPESRR